MKNNLAIVITSDPNLLKILDKLQEPTFAIPDYTQELKDLRALRATDKGVLVSKVTSPDDFQAQLHLLGLIQHCLDRVHEISVDLYIILSRWKALSTNANRFLTMHYFDELNALKEGVRKSVIAAALHPVQCGMDKLNDMVEMVEMTQKHLINANWNIKESTTIIKEYLALYKYAVPIREEI